MTHIYVIEDDDNIRDLVRIALEGYGYQVSAFEQAEEALIQMEQEKPDMAVFDLMLPGMNGMDAIKEIRNKEEGKRLPIIILTAKDKEIDKVIGLDGGADDYITKPFGVMELAARIRSLLRRSSREEEGELVKGRLTINPKTREVRIDTKWIELTLKEFNLLLYLAENEDRVVPREELLDKIWGYDYIGETRTLDMHIRTLRQKLGENMADCIKTLRGIGYRFQEKEKEE